MYDMNWSGGGRRGSNHQLNRHHRHRYHDHSADDGVGIDLRRLDRLDQTYFHSGAHELCYRLKTLHSDCNDRNWVGSWMVGSEETLLTLQLLATALNATIVEGEDE